jgi:hypothetical protein
MMMIYLFEIKVKLMVGNEKRERERERVVAEFFFMAYKKYCMCLNMHRMACVELG